MARYKQVQASMLRFCTDVSIQESLTLGKNFTAVNLDAHADEENLPEGNIIGIESLAMQSATDAEPTDTFSCSVTVGTVSDTNNMLISNVVDSVYELLLPESTMVLYSPEMAKRVGTIKVFGRTQILPVQRGDGTGRVFQSVVFQAVALSGSA